MRKIEQMNMSTKKMLALLAGTSIMGGATARGAPVNVEGGLIVCVGAEALESVSDNWEKPGCLFHCLAPPKTR